MKNKTVSLLCKSAFMLDGNLVAPGKTANGVPAGEAEQLVRRGKATLAMRGDVTQGAQRPADGADEDQPLDTMSVQSLKDLAAEYDIAGAAQMKKADLVAAIEKAEADEDEEEGQGE